MFRLKDDSFLSKAKEGSTLGDWFKDIKTRGSVQNVTQRNTRDGLHRIGNQTTV